MSTPFDFGGRFIKSKGQPIQHAGRTLQMIGRFPAALGEELVVTIESTASPHIQGIGFSEDVEVFGQKEKKAVVFEHFSIPPEERARTKSRLPFTFAVTCRSKKGFLSFYNMALTGDCQSWWHAGSAMIAEDIAGGRRYLCNDFDFDDDFDDLIFTVKKKEPNQAAQTTPGSCAPLRV
jgi:hypothetical protein